MHIKQQVIGLLQPFLATQGQLSPLSDFCFHPQALFGFLRLLLLSLLLVSGLLLFDFVSCWLVLPTELLLNLERLGFQFF
mmetsp:Transcript_13985/g.21812  ORF Transcript_13985/g.21812 Transcript_13985/m.21812 type:complete len:80 (+) Transcript_13985:162-401(+)